MAGDGKRPKMEGMTWINFQVATVTNFKFTAIAKAQGRDRRDVFSWLMDEYVARHSDQFQKIWDRPRVAQEPVAEPVAEEVTEGGPVTIE
jgi:hypothetical protein